MFLCEPDIRWSYFKSQALQAAGDRVGQNHNVCNKSSVKLSTINIYHFAITAICAMWWSIFSYNTIIITCEPNGEKRFAATLTPQTYLFTWNIDKNSSSTREARKCDPRPQPQLQALLSSINHLIVIGQMPQLIVKNFYVNIAQP